ncbi:MAG: trypsin-like peptidase domain-containing protein [Armatimonadetes bacterium]|nr:trypsin-like peptidase domain-containing protein [Armatimonadota bacterium]MDW8029105.1 trypsin-like peptidase domain-containing protein [Armatimonadota bacterium]
MRWLWTVLVFGLAVGLVIGYQIARLQKSSVPTDLIIPLRASAGKSVASLSEAFVKVAKASEESVVHIATTAPVPEEYRMFRQFFFGEEVPKRVPANYGSGFFFRRDGYILTNFHVIQGSDTIKVGIDEQTEFPARLIGYDPLLDVAVIKVDGGNRQFKALPLGDSDKLEKGEWVIAIGNPFGLDKTVTVGVVSAKGREFEEIDGRPAITSYIQTDAAINPGNSGGPLLNLNGEVVGINTFIIGQGGNIGIGFALPINEIKRILNRLLKGGRITRGALGVVLVDADSPEAREMGIQVKEGAVIVSVAFNSPAYLAGLRPGDVIVMFKGVSIKDSSQLRRIVLQQPGGAVVDVEVLRDKRRLNFKVTLGSR